MLMPKSTKFRKQQRGVSKGNSTRGIFVTQGDFGLSAMERGMVTARQIEAVRVAITRCMKRGGKMYIMIFPDYPYTKKPAETRMGKGKGNLEEWVVRVKPGRVLFEIAGVPIDVAKRAFQLASSKLSIKAKFVVKDLV